MKNKKSQSGYSLLEALVALLLINLLLCMAAPVAVQMARFEKMKSAKARVQIVSRAQAEIVRCERSSETATVLMCDKSFLPQGTVVIDQYLYTFVVTGNSWAYTAIPRDPENVAFYVDESGVLRSAKGTANIDSPVAD
jgi:type II secretory pathway pseudopilin PulG